mmetsp:Transcript_48125/g.145359  ORF Transcript_48125/g.145359 Transcript_48125/m.145359 type:complete len:112 (-) Transcript_48125:32-367(-)
MRNQGTILSANCAFSFEPCSPEEELVHFVIRLLSLSLALSSPMSSCPLKRADECGTHTIESNTPNALINHSMQLKHNATAVRSTQNQSSTILFHLVPQLGEMHDISLQYST